MDETEEHADQDLFLSFQFLAAVVHPFFGQKQVLDDRRQGR